MPAKMRTLLDGRARIFFVVCVLIAAYFIYTAISGAIHNHRLSQDVATANAVLAQLEQRKAYLEGVKKYTASDAYVEQEARRRLGFIRAGEIPFVVESPPLPEDDQPSGDWWERLFPR